jgi:hypothetical protein
MERLLHQRDSNYCKRLDGLHSKRLSHRGQNYKDNFDLKTEQHKFSIGEKVWLSDTASNVKLTPKWISPFDIVDINDKHAKLKVKNGKMKVVNVMRIKPYLEEPTNRLWCKHWRF